MSEPATETKKKSLTGDSLMEWDIKLLICHQCNSKPCKCTVQNVKKQTNLSTKPPKGEPKRRDSTGNNTTSHSANLVLTEDKEKQNRRSSISTKVDLFNKLQESFKHAPVSKSSYITQSTNDLVNLQNIEAPKRSQVSHTVQHFIKLQESFKHPQISKCSSVAKSINDLVNLEDIEAPKRSQVSNTIKHFTKLQQHRVGKGSDVIKSVDDLIILQDIEPANGTEINKLHKGSDVIKSVNDLTNLQDIEPANGIEMNKLQKHDQVGKGSDVIKSVDDLIILQDINTQHVIDSNEVKALQQLGEERISLELGTLDSFGTIDSFEGNEKNVKHWIKYFEKSPGLNTKKEKLEVSRKQKVCNTINLVQNDSPEGITAEKTLKNIQKKSCVDKENEKLIEYELNSPHSSNLNMTPNSTLAIRSPPLPPKKKGFIPTSGEDKKTEKLKNSTKLSPDFHKASNMTQPTCSAPTPPTTIHNEPSKKSRKKCTHSYNFVSEKFLYPRPGIVTYTQIYQIKRKEQAPNLPHKKIENQTPGLQYNKLNEQTSNPELKKFVETIQDYISSKRDENKKRLEDIFIYLRKYQSESHASKELIKKIMTDMTNDNNSLFKKLDENAKSSDVMFYVSKLGAENYLKKVLSNMEKTIEYDTFDFLEKQNRILQDYEKLRQKNFSNINIYFMPLV